MLSLDTVFAETAKERPAMSNTSKRKPAPYPDDVAVYRRLKRKEVRFAVPKAEALTIYRIAARAYGLARAYNSPITRTLLDWRMDITACHANGMPLDLERLAAADDFNLIHDAFGIARHLDRESGALRDCFVPRFRRREPEAWERAKARAAKLASRKVA